MKYFFMKLNPPRPTFTQDMSPEERGIMQRHVAYWTDKMEKGSRWSSDRCSIPRAPTGSASSGSNPMSSGTPSLPTTPRTD